MLKLVLDAFVEKEPCHPHSHDQSEADLGNFVQSTFAPTVTPSVGHWTLTAAHHPVESIHLIRERDLERIRASPPSSEALSVRRFQALLNRTDDALPYVAGKLILDC